MKLDAGCRLERSGNPDLSGILETALIHLTKFRLSGRIPPIARDGQTDELMEVISHCLLPPAAGYGPGERSDAG